MESDSDQTKIIHIDPSILEPKKQKRKKTPRVPSIKKLTTKTIKNKILSKIANQINVASELDSPASSADPEAKCSDSNLISEECKESLSLMQSMKQDAIKKKLKRPKKQTAKHHPPEPPPSFPSFSSSRSIPSTSSTPAIKQTLSFNDTTTIQVYSPDNTIFTDNIQTDVSKLPVPPHESNGGGADPPFGVLKHGNKQTFRQWKQGGGGKSTTPKRMKKKVKQTIRKSYVTGKYKDATVHRVGVFIKDASLQNKIHTACSTIATIPIYDIKKYLLKHNIIKIDSNAPDSVLRSMYESALLSGDIVNTNSSNMVYNYTNHAKK